MERMRRTLTRRWLELVAIVALAATGSAPTPALAQPGSGPATVTLRVVDQDGTVLQGSTVQELGSDQVFVTPATVTIDAGFQIFLISPAFQGAMFPGGALLPSLSNGLSRTDFVMVDGVTPTLDFTWQCAHVPVSVVDQDGAPIAGAHWGFAGEGAWFDPGDVLAPVNDASVYPTLAGPAAAGWNLAAQAAFLGSAIDLSRTEARNVGASTTALALEWRQSSCNMGVVDATGAALRGATWTMLGHTFAEGDAITLPVTDAATYPTVGGALAAGIPTLLHTNTPAGDGAATFAVHADGSLSPDPVSIGGETFALRCGVSAPPPVGALAGTVTMDGAPFAGAALTVLDAASASHALTTDAAGAFALAELPPGAATVTVTVPAGTHAVSPASGQIVATIVADQTAHVGFALATDPPPPPPTGALAGVVTKDGVPYAGAVLSVVDAVGAAHPVATGVQGTFAMDGLPLGDATVTLTLPAGTHAVDPANGQATVAIVAEKTANVAFSIASDAPPPPLVDNPESRDYWWKEAKSAQKGKGPHAESFADMRTNFPQAIFDRFANDSASPVRVQGVTQVDPDGSGPMVARRLTIDDLEASLSPSHPSALNDARSELLVILLNVVSDRLSLELVVDAQGTTLAQEIRILAAMINDGSPANDAIARSRAMAINSGHLELRQTAPYGSGVTPATTGLVPAAAALVAVRGADGGVSFAMTLPADGPVALDVYDVTGRHVATLWHGATSLGITNVAWSASGVRPGMYFARMTCASGALGAKVLVAR